jgi:hypothetical protein
MPASTSRSAARFAVAVVCALLVAACGGKGDTSTAASKPAATSTSTAPTTTTAPPMTAKELAWLKAIPTVSKKIEKTIDATNNLTSTAMAGLASSLRSCTRVLVRGGSPSDRLQPVYVLVKKGCKEYDKGAACFATAASVGIPYAGSPAERKQQTALDCGFVAPGKGALFLADAESKGEEIKAEAG